MSLFTLGQKAVTRTHIFWYRATGGLVGSRIGGIRMLLLTTKGRKSGRRRTTPLTYIEHGDTMALIASNGGAPGHPAWYLNLRDNPEVTVQIGRRKIRMLARTAKPDERGPLWEEAVRVYSGYEGYQKRTQREIPVVILERA